ncbi:hypothetical protein [Nitrincola sp.]
MVQVVVQRRLTAGDLATDQAGTTLYGDIKASVSGTDRALLADTAG